MEVAVIVLGIVAAVLLAGLVWALLAKGGSDRAAAAATARAEGAERLALEAADDEKQARETLNAEVAEARARADESGKRVLELSQERTRLATQLDEMTHRLAREQQAVQEERTKLDEQLKGVFARVSNDTLRAQTEQFVKVMGERLDAGRKESSAELDKRRERFEQLVKPIGEKLGELDNKLHATGESAAQLRDETGRLVRALSRPEVRGRYGEIQLRRVAELAGMVDYCDFTEQTSTRTDDGSLLRPDMVVQLPNDRVVAVDAKTNIDAYVNAVNAPDEDAREAELTRFARHVAEQAKKLSDKKYWDAVRKDGGHTPEFVVMFVPGDHFIDAALSRRPDLLETAALHNVILASPSTLIGLLRAVAVGWREHTFSQEAHKILQLGQDLHKRSGTLLEHVAKLGNDLGRSVDSYNRAVGSIERGLLPQLRRFEDAGAKSAKSLAEPKLVEGSPRGLPSGTPQD